MPKELPGFYYDPEKNRYFPIKSRIPGSASHSPKPLQVSNPEETHKQCTPRRKDTKTTALLQLRELDGNIIGSTRSKSNFQHEYQNQKASQPTIWQYKSIERIAYGALEQLHINMQTHEGIEKRQFLLTGKGDSVSLFGVEQVGERFDCGVKYRADPIWSSLGEYQADRIKAPGLIWIQGAEIPIASPISSIKTTDKCSATSIQYALISTLGSETSGGSVFVLKPDESVDFTSLPYIYRSVTRLASLKCTIWTAEYHPDGSQAVIGTDKGAALLNLETGAVSWLCRAKSDVFSLQYNQGGKAILCGFRNGAIVTIDAREKPQTLHEMHSKHRIPINSNTNHECSSRTQKRTKGWFELKGRLHAPSTIFMPSSISSLISLQTDDQYFLASSMDGSIKLYDHRLIQRGAVQSYEGHVNSHTRIQLGVDPSERIMTSGGEDGKVRIWSIKTGKLLFETKLSSSPVATMCCPRTQTELMGVGLCSRHSGAWMGSAEDLFYIHAS